MGNIKRFRFSHMIPNAWFYRLRDMNIATTPHHKTLKQQQQQQPENHPRNSLCYTPKIHQVDRNHNKKATQSTQHLFFSPTNCSLSESTQSLSTTCSFGDNTKKIQDSSGYHELIIQETEFQENNEDTSSQSSISTETIYEYENPRRKNLVSGVKMRSKAQRKYTCKRIVYDIDDQNKMSSSCCVVKPTFDPLTELKESMMEMITECNMHATKDLEKLLTCYLSLNSSENHDNIVKAFKEVCLTFDFVV